MQVSDQIIRSLFNHLVQSYSASEACDIMIEKYPHAEGDIRILMQHGYTPTEEETVMDQVNVVENASGLVEVPAADLKKAVKAKVAKTKRVHAPQVKAKAPKAPKAAKPAKAAKAAKGPSKMDRARELYAASSDKSRKAMMDVFAAQLGLGKAAASTYFYAVKS